MTSEEFDVEVLLSIVLPIYNVSKYLDDCMKTIIGKNEDLVEILLIDDGSTDDSGKIADSYAVCNKNVKTYHKKNGGLSDARNYGLLRAKGKYVFFLDSDDFVKDEMIDILVEVLSTKKLEVLLWDADIYDQYGNRMKVDSSYYHHMGVAENVLCTGQKVIESQLAYRNDYVTTVWLGLYNRDFLINNNFWFEKDLLHEDEMWTQKVLIEAKKVMYINSGLYCYRMRENSIMRQVDKDYTRNIAALIYIHSSLLSYYDWKVIDDNFKKKLKGNTVKRYLHMIGKYQVYRYHDLAKRINRRQLFLNATEKKDKIRSLLLMVNIQVYCIVVRYLKMH